MRSTHTTYHSFVDTFITYLVMNTQHEALQYSQIEKTNDKKENSHPRKNYWLCVYMCVRERLKLQN